MIRAYPTGDKYKLVGDTYYLRDSIKKAGGTWDGHNWYIAEAGVESLPVTKMVLVEIGPHCHITTNSRIYVTEYDYNIGMVRVGCDRCDTVDSCVDMVTIIRVIRPLIK